jgi:hypothetical protein
MTRLIFAFAILLFGSAYGRELLSSGYRGGYYCGYYGTLSASPTIVQPRRLMLSVTSQPYWSTIATTTTVWSTTIVTPNWYMADTNGFGQLQNQYVSSGFLTMNQDVPRQSNPLSVKYEIVATKVHAGYTELSIKLTSNGKMVGLLTGQTSLLPGTKITGHAAIRFK